MFDERAFIARVESAGTDELAQIMLRPTGEEEQALRVYFGDDRFERLRQLALKRTLTRGARELKGNVVVIHGIMGAELSAFDRKGAGEQVWAKVLRLANGWLDRLRLSEDGKAEYSADYDVRATGIMKRYYGELLLSLSERWNVRAFWFDWRKDLNLAAESLKTQISGWFRENSPVHIVAHSMGGLVARTFAGRYPDRWRTMLGEQSGGKAGGRLIMLGTPNHGSFVIPQVITGLEGLVRKLALVDLRHSLSDLQAILNSFVGTYQMLPSPFAMESMEPLYRSQTYGEDLKVPQLHLDSARDHHKWLRGVVDPERMIYVAGYNQPTFSDIRDMSNLKSMEVYGLTTDGDGRVPHALGLLEADNGKKVKTYFIEEDHGSLTINERVLASLDELLETGATSDLPDKLPSSRAIGGHRATEIEVRTRLVASQAAEEARLQSLVPPLRVRGTNSHYLTSDEREVEEILTRGFLSHREDKEPNMDKPVETSGPARTDEVRIGKARIEIGLVYGGIESIDRPLDGKAVDAISVGHYLGVKPQYAELALDRAISRALPQNKRTPLITDSASADLILTQYSERGTIRGELGQTFFLADPRTTKGGNAAGQRVIAIAGMGVPARFGEPELTVLARELCWALGRMGKRHLATVLIGSGAGNLSVREAVSGWLRGIKNAVTGSIDEDRRRLGRITFVEQNPGKVEEIQNAILEERERLQDRLTIDYVPINEHKLTPLRAEAIRREQEKVKKQIESKTAARAQDAPKTDIPTRLTLELERKTYRFGAITRDAAVPVREVPLDPALVMDANDELAAERKPEMQLERGRFMEKLLLPDDLRESLYVKAPLVMMLDATTARIHWEMVALTEGVGASDKAEFLGLSRGFTRQLRTTFAPPPEPPPPPRRVLRVLVVADPAEDAPLVGAQQEGLEVADLFESFNEVYSYQKNTVAVVRMIGPQAAKRTNVLRELMLRSYDVLHFAGHCVFDTVDPTSSGWIFTGGQRLTASELKRIDRVPKFVFSNACESGITPDRSEKRSVDLAPSFAESFFGRGVANFVCTAWPVEDDPARQFALRLYSGLLGLSKTPAQGKASKSGTQTIPYQRGLFEPMHEAMREARRTIGANGYGGRTWGAYQHYGNPYFRFFDAITMERDLVGSQGVGDDGPSTVTQKTPRRERLAKERSKKKK
jgi:pimeloyl-ACP methyl ester carboxylesterase